MSSYMQSNQPYSRVEDGVGNGIAWGAVGGAAAAGAAIGGTYGHMKALPKIADHKIEVMNHKNGKLNDLEMRTMSESYDEALKVQNKRGNSTRTSSINPGVGEQILNNVNDFKNRRLDRKNERISMEHEAEMNKIATKREKLQNKFGKWTDKDYVQGRVDNHFYNKNLGGWKGKAIAGGIGIAGGMIAGGITDKLR